MKNISNLILNSSKTLALILLPILGMVQATTNFVTTWDTGASTAITIPANGGGYLYDVDWNNDGTFDDIGVTGNITHNFGSTGNYTIRIRQEII